MLVRLTEAGTQHVRIFSEINELESITALYHEEGALRWVAGYSKDGRRVLYEKKSERNWISHDIADQLGPEIVPDRNPVCFLHRDRQGAMWIGSDHGGIARFDGKTWTHFYGAIDGLDSHDLWGACSAVETDVGIIFDSGHLYDGTQFRPLDPESQGPMDLVKVVKDSQGRVWGLMGSFLDKQLVLLSADPEFNEKDLRGRSVENPLDIGINANGDLWVVGETSGYAVLFKNEWVPFGQEIPWDFPKSWHHRMNGNSRFHVDADNRLWFIDENLGLRRTR